MIPYRQIKMEHLKDKKYWINRIWQGHTLDILRQMPDEMVDMVITSPPYYSLRDYGTDPQVWGGDPACVHQWDETITAVSSGMLGMNERLQKETDNRGSKFVEEGFNKPKTSKNAFCRGCGAWKGELGLEPDFNLFVDHLVMVFEEVKRVLKPTGSCYVNMGDTYGGACSRASEGGRAGFGDPREIVVNRGYDKCLLMVPERFAIAMIDRGWILRNKIVWCLEETTKLFVKIDGLYYHLTIKELYDRKNKNIFVLTQDIQGKNIWIKVKNIFNNGQQECLKIVTKTGREIVCNFEQQFVYKKTSIKVENQEFRKIKIKKANELNDKDYLYVNINVDCMQEGIRDDYDKGFVVGFYLAEGSFVKNRIGVYKNTKYFLYAQRRWGKNEKQNKIVAVQFSCGIDDIKRGYIDKLKMYDVKIRQYGNCVNVQSRDRNLLDLIQEFVQGDLCDGKYLTNKVYNQSKKFLEGIIDGFVSGDGYYNKERYTVRIKPNYNLKDDLMLICRLLGYDFRFYSVYKVKNNNKYYDVMSFAIRKNSYRSMQFNCYSDKVEKIEKVGIKNVYDIEVEPIYTSYCGKGKSSKITKEKKKNKYNNLYFLSNGVWTHNCKPNAMPSSVTDRLKNTWEYVFFFTKNKKYYYDLNAIREAPKSLVEVPQPQTINGGDSQLDLIQCEVENKPEVEINIPSSPKYEGQEGHSNRQGLNRKLDTVTLKAYKEYQQPIARYLKRYIRKEHEIALNQVFGEHKWGHWIRTDLSGASLPGVDDWAKLKEILQFDNEFDEKIYEVQNLNIPIFSSGSNPGDLFKISTQAFPESHFAVFPEKLVIKPIRASCPEFVCCKCGQPMVKVYQKGQPIEEWKKDCGADSKGEYIGQGQKEYGQNNVQNPSDVKRRTLDSMREQVLTGYIQCECNAGFEPGIVMDIFSGAGTTCMVANNLGRYYIGIELNPKYIEMSEKRILKDGNPLFKGGYHATDGTE